MNGSPVGFMGGEVDARGPAQPLLAPWTMELRDRDAELRFRRYHIRQRRKTLLAGLSFIAVVTLAAVLTSVPSDGGAGTAMWAVVFGLVAGSAVLIGLLFLTRRTRNLYRLSIAIMVFVTAVVAALIVFGDDMDVRGGMLLVFGVVAIHLSGPVTLRYGTAMGLLFSAVTVPLWLLFTGAPTSDALNYVLLTVALMHGLGIVESRRSQRERRLLFVQQEELREQSRIDPLTGLYNRRSFDEILRDRWHEVENRSEPLCALMIDIDQFKLLNDRFGHTSGDAVLRSVSSVIAGSMPNEQCVAGRYGGDEFVCILADVDADSAVATARTILARVRAPEVPSAVSDRAATALSVSIGLAHAENGMDGPEELVREADRHLYIAKSHGRDQGRYWGGLI